MIMLSSAAILAVSKITVRKKNNLNHMAAEQAVSFAAAARADTLILTHFWHQIPVKEYAARAGKRLKGIDEKGSLKIICAKPGLILQGGKLAE